VTDRPEATVGPGSRRPGNLSVPWHGNEKRQT
jgi:hypothetical protein